MSKRPIITKPRSRFLKVQCLDCSHEQPIFSKVSSTVTCEVCGATLARSTGGKSTIKGRVRGVLD